MNALFLKGLYLEKRAAELLQYTIMGVKSYHQVITLNCYSTGVKSYHSDNFSLRESTIVELRFYEVE